MSRQIYKRSVAPHQARVASDGGVPTDAVNAAILLAIDNQEWEGKDKCLIYSPELTGNKLRVNGIYTHATKGYSANSPQRELGDELITNQADREFTSDTGFWSKTDAVISGGLVNINHPSGFAALLRRSSILQTNKTYSLTFTIAITSGTVNVYIGDSVQVISTSGKHTITLNSISQTAIQFASSQFVGTIDNISLREVLPADLTQTTANSQPYLGKINPSEPQHLQNQNGDVRFMSHTAISFAANEKWAYETIVKWNGTSTAGSVIFGNGVAAQSICYITTAGALFFRNQSGASSQSGVLFPQYIGKSISLHLVALGNGSLLVYINKVLSATLSIATDITFIRFMAGSASANAEFYGLGYELAIIPDALSADRIAYRSALLRSIFPEIPTVRIAGMDIACRALDIVCTPAGNLIPNVTDNAAWAALTTPAWCHHTNDVALGTVYGKAYNGYARTTLVTDLASSGFGYHVATKEELTTLMESGLAIKAMGTNYWTTANGTNITGATLLGGASRNTDGTFATIKGSVMFWCADADECLTLLDNGTISIDAKDLKTGAYILLIKDYAGDFVYDSLGEQIFDVNGVPWISV